MARIALDAMGGDHAPAEIVAGAVEVAKEGVDVVLVGDAAALTDELAEHDYSLPVVDAPDTIGMGDDPTRALREKPNASIPVAARLVAEGEAAAFVSAGSTGAAMAAAVLILGRIRGVARPAIATVFPTPGTRVLVLDSGANPDVKPEQLAQFGIMGSVAAEVLLGVSTPRVALLSNGGEKGKGRDLEKAAYDLLEAGPTNFVGNYEGGDLAHEKADVVVTDGFTGNIFLKTMEGSARVTGQYFLEGLAVLDAETRQKVLPVIGAVRTRMDPETYGGAHLLGVKGVVIIAHGSSSRVAIGNALRMARDGAEHGLPERLTRELG